MRESVMPNVKVGNKNLSTDYVYHYYHGYSSRVLPKAGYQSKGIFTALRHKMSFV
jgi:hypothetical protein